jgi:signal transduction histidine kinase
MARLSLTDIPSPDRKGFGDYLPAVIGAVVLAGLYLARLYSYLLFHSLVEVFSVGVAFSIFTVFWNSRRFVTNGFYLFLGIAYFGIAAIDLVHTLAYDGMGVFQGYGPNLPTQLWIAGMSLETLSWLAAPLFLGKRLNASAVLMVYTALLATLFGLVFYWQVFPTCYVEGTGLTAFKKISEYVISVGLVAAIFQLRFRRRELDPGVLRLLITALLITIASDLSFTLYNDVYGLANLVGHFLKLCAYYLIYKAFVEVALTQPLALLFRDLKQNEAGLKALNATLEQRIVERTAVAEHRATQLRALAWELTQTEQRERRRLAQILHDHLQQLLFAGKLGLSRVQRHLADDGPRNMVAQIDQMLQEAINVSRSLTVELSPPILYDGGLAAAMEWLARQMHEKHGLVVRAEADHHLGPIAEDTSTLLFQSVRELLFNVVKHAKAESAWIQLQSAADDRICVTVTDSGVGFDPGRPGSSQSSGGFGLFSMRERIELIGGSFEIESSPGKGTRVTIIAPREKSAESMPHGHSQDDGLRLP